MNLALPTLVVLLGILPGIACFYGYFAGRFDKRTAALSGVEELALYVLFAIPLDAFALIVCRRLGVPFNFDIALHLLTGAISDVDVHKEISGFFQGWVETTTITYLIVLATSFVAGSATRRVVWASRYDTWVPHLRLRNTWFYVLQGRIDGLPRNVVSYVDVLTDLPDQDGSKTRLFRGLVIDFETSPSGGLESLTLKNAFRGKGRGPDFKWAPIPSSRFLIMGSAIHSINVTYLSIGETDAPTGWKVRTLGWLRSFIRGEP